MKLKDRISARIPEEKRRPIRKALRAARVVKNIICWTMIVILPFKGLPRAAWSRR